MLIFTVANFIKFDPNQVDPVLFFYTLLVIMGTLVYLYAVTHYQSKDKHPDHDRS
jgi:hypothetical protein